MPCVTFQTCYRLAISVLFYIYAESDIINLPFCLDTAIAVVSFALVVIYFPAKPPKPPSKSQTIERENFWVGLKHLAT